MNCLINMEFFHQIRLQTVYAQLMKRFELVSHENAQHVETIALQNVLTEYIYTCIYKTNLEIISYFVVLRVNTAFLPFNADYSYKL